MKRNDLKDGLSSIVDELVRRGVTLEQARKEFERQFIVASIRSNAGNLGRSAQSLGVHRNTLRNKVSNLGIATEDYNSRAGKGRSTAGRRAGRQRPQRRRPKT
jgi:DNA-binding NtrC family response regulator